MKKKHYLLFALCEIVILLFFEFQVIVFKGPESLHNWRQADCASFALMYYNSGMHFFEPMVHNQLGAESKGHAVGEFPILYFIVAILYKIFGVHNFIYRLFFMSIFIASQFALLNLAYRITGNQFIAFVIPLLLFSSPLIMLYSASFLSDTCALSFAIIALNYSVRYFDAGKLSSFWLSVFCFTLAALLKLNSVVVLVSLAGLLFIELAGWHRFGKVSDGVKSNLFAHSKQNVIGYAVSFVVVLSWYLWAIQYNAKYNTIFLGTQSWPGWPIWEVDNNSLVEALKNFIKNQTHFFNLWTFILIIISYGAIFLMRKEIEDYEFFLFITVSVGFLMFFLYFFVGINVNVYYFINLMMLPVLIYLFIAKILTKKFPVIINSIAFKVLVILFLVSNLATAKLKLHSYYHGGENHFRAKDEYYNPQLQVFLDSIGVKKNDKVVSIPDFTPNVTLYLMDRTGWSGYNFFNNKPDFKAMNDCIAQGARYLIIGDKNLLLDNEINSFANHYVGTFNTIYVYKLDEKKVEVKQPDKAVLRINSSANFYHESNFGQLKINTANNSDSVFDVIYLTPNKVVFQTSKGKLLSARDDMDNKPVLAANDFIGEWEVFDIVTENNRRVLKSNKGEFLGVDQMNNLCAGTTVEKDSHVFMELVNKK